MKTKKLLSLILALVMCLGLMAGCGGQAPADDPAADPAPETQSPDNSKAPDQSGNDTAPADSASRIDEYLDFDTAEVMLDNYCSVALLRGSWHDMGVQYAQQFPDEIKRFVAGKLAGYIGTWGSMDAVYEVLPQYTEMLDFFPGYLDFTYGMAEELGLTQEDALAAMLTLAPPEFSCMATSAWGDATFDGNTYSVMHSDSSHEPIYYLPAIIAYPDDGNAFISATGFSNCYLNEKGLVSMTTMGYGFLETDTAPGLPACFGALYTSVYTDTAAQAKDAYIEHCLPGSAEITQFSDVSGDGYVVEATAGHYDVRTAGDFGETDYLIQANGWKTEEMQQSLPGDLPDNITRYDSVEYVFQNNLGKLDMDTMRSALAQTSYYDKATGQWIYSWNLENDESYNSPENKDLKYGCAIRRAMDPSTLTMHIMMGSEYDLVSKVPYALGSYCSITLNEDIASMVRMSEYNARLQIWYAAQDIEAARNSGKDVSERMEYFNIARQAIYEACSFRDLGALGADENEQLEHYAESLSLFNKVMTYARAAQENPAQIVR